MLHPHVVSQELAEELRKLGWPQNRSTFYWWKDDFGDWAILSSEDAPDDPDSAIEPDRFIASPLASELLERMPSHFLDSEGLRYDLNLWKDTVWNAAYWWDEDSRRLVPSMNLPAQMDANPCDALAKLAIYLMKEGIIKF